MTLLKYTNNRRGFSLLELMVVMSILAILLTIAVPIHKRHTLRAREAVLAENLYQMRNAIDTYYADKAKYPEDLDNLVSERYLRNLPKDPFTNSSETWETDTPEPNEEGEIPEGGVFDVHSGSKETGTNGVPYSEW